MKQCERSAATLQGLFLGAWFWSILHVDLVVLTEICPTIKSLLILRGGSGLTVVVRVGASPIYSSASCEEINPREKPQENLEKPKRRRKGDTLTLFLYLN